MSSLNNTITNNIESFKQILNAQTDMDRLAKCTIDLRDARVDPCEGSSAVPRLFVITLIDHDNNYDAYINNYVTVGDIFCKMIELKLISNADEYHLLPEETAQTPFDLSQSFANVTDASRFRLEKKPLSAVPTEVVIITTLTGRQIMINVFLKTDTISVLKERIKMKEGIPVDQQRLVFNGKPLEDNLTLTDYNISNENIIHLILRLRKPVIRLKSLNNQVINNVSISVELDPHLWTLSSLYPTPSITNGKNFVQWNDMNVYPDGKISFKTNISSVNRIYPSIEDENEYRMLFWEAFTNTTSDDLLHSKNLCVPRGDFSRVLNYLLKKMSFSSEDRDLDEIDPEYKNEKIIFHFLSPQLYSSTAQLTIRPRPQQLIRAFLIFAFGNNVDNISTIDELENEITKTMTTDNLTNSGLVVHEWGSMFVY